MSKPRQKDNVQCAFCGKKMQLRSIGGHWRMLGHPNNVNLDDRYLCIEEESSSTSDSSSNANDSSSNDGTTTTGSSSSSDDDDDSSDDGQATVHVDRILNDDTLKVDAIVQDEEQIQQKREFSESDDEADEQDAINDDDGIDDDQFFDAELRDIVNAHFQRIEDEDVQERADDVEEEDKKEEL
eukprot:825914_1